MTKKILFILFIGVSFLPVQPGIHKDAIVTCSEISSKNTVSINKIVMALCVIEKLEKYLATNKSKISPDELNQLKEQKYELYRKVNELKNSDSLLSIEVDILLRKINSYKDERKDKFISILLQELKRK